MRSSSGTRSLRLTLQNVEDLASSYTLGLSPFSNGFGQSEIFEDLGEDLVEQFALLVQRFGERFFHRLLKRFVDWVCLCHFTIRHCIFPQ